MLLPSGIKKTIIYLKKIGFFKKFWKNKGYVIFLIYLLTFSWFIYMYIHEKYISDMKNEEFVNGAPGTLDLPVPVRGVFTIELDYSKDIKFNPLLLKFMVFMTYWGSKILVNVIIDDPLDIDNVTFSYDNCTEYALLFNSTRDYPRALHIIMLHNFTVNGYSTFWGYSMYLPYWQDMVKNYSKPSYTGCLVAYDCIMNRASELMVYKCVAHESGHSLGCTHKNFGVMRPGEISILEFYFCYESQIEMNPFNIFGIDQGFDRYI